MATYIPQITDYIPQVQRFQPDLNLYNSILQVKQTKYDAARKRIGTLYGSLLNAPLTREDNIERRDKFFKMIDQDIKKISSMDLSLQQNVEAASAIFDPLLKDTDIKHDMIFTKHISDQMYSADLHKNCLDPDKCGGQYSKDSVLALQLKLEDYKKAGREDALKMSLPDYAPNINIVDKAFKWAKDNGLNVNSVSSDGKYLITRQNGMNLLVPLQNIYAAMYGNDPQVKAMYDTQAYLKRKQYIAENAPRFGMDESKAENEWFKEVLSKTAKNLQTDIINSKTISDDVKKKFAALSAKAKRVGVIEYDDTQDPLYDDLKSSADESMIVDEVSKYYDQLQELINSVDNTQGDSKALRERVDSIVSTGLLNEGITRAASLYALSHNSITDVKADPYGLEIFKHKLDLENKQVDFFYDLQLEAFKMSADMFNKYMMQGTDASNQPTYLDKEYKGNVTPGGSYSLYNESLKTIVETGQGVNNAEYSYYKTVLDHLNSVISDASTSDAEKTYAKSQKAQILGKNYDPNTDTYIKGNNRTKDLSEGLFDPIESGRIYRNAQTAVKGSPGMYSDIRNNLAAYEDNIKVGSLARELATDVLKQNNQAIHDYALSSVDVEDKGAFSNLFKPVSGGGMYLKTKEEYIKDALGAMRSQSGSIEEKRKYASLKYDQQHGIYVQLFNSGKVKGIMPPKFENSLLKTSVDGGVYSPGVVYQFDQGLPFHTGTKALLSWDKSMENGFLKITPGAANADKEQYAELPDNDLNARALWDTLISDIKNGQYQTNEQKAKRPVGKIMYFGTAGQDANKISMTVYPSYSYLKEYAEKDPNTKKDFVFGKPIEEWVRDGVTVFMDKQSANDFLTDKFKSNPIDAILDNGKPITISRPNVGAITISKTTDGVNFKGKVTSYQRLEDGTYKKFIKNLNVSQPHRGASGFDLYTTMNAYVDALSKMNEEVETLGRSSINIGSPEEILKMSGNRDYSPQEMLAKSMKERMAMTMQLMRSIMPTQ